ncbi:MAG: hypothetical protein IJS89_08500 [Bacteroidaceae bacterium]|nr:hypothetical protein [Bacteroidaceae bacterium]
MKTSVFSPAQLRLLQMFSTIHTEEEMREVEVLLHEYYFNRIERMTSDLAKKNGWTPQTLESMSHEHLRTPYK